MYMYIHVAMNLHAILYLCIYIPHTIQDTLEHLLVNWHCTKVLTEIRSVQTLQQGISGLHFKQVFHFNSVQIHCSMLVTV